MSNASVSYYVYRTRRQVVRKCDCCIALTMELPHSESACTDAN